jgi:hypothetical protein
MRKFGRNFRLTIYPPDSGAPIIVNMPFTVNFLIERNDGSEVNKMDIEIYNLSKANRTRIFQDRYYQGAYETSAGQPLLNADGNLLYTNNIIFECGYGNTLYRAFDGQMFQASSAREGSNIVTRITALQGNIATSSGQINETVQSGETLSSVLRRLIGYMPTLQVGAIGNFDTVFNRPVVLNGNVWELIKQYSENQCYIDNGKVYVLKTSEVLQTVTTLNDASGLLQTPRRDIGFLQIQTLLESSINVGQQVNVQSSIQPEYNGTYKCIALQHKGTISGAVCGKLSSVFSLLAPNQFNNFTVVPQE